MMKTHFLRFFSMAFIASPSIRLILILLFMACVGSAHSLKCTSCSPCSQGQDQDQDTSQSVDCSSDVCFTEKHDGRMTKGCVSREELAREGIQIGGVGHVRLDSNGKEKCYCRGTDYCDCDIGVDDSDDESTMKSEEKTDIISNSTMSSTWINIKTFVASKLETPWTLWTAFVSRLSSNFTQEKSESWSDHFNQMPFFMLDGPRVKCFSCMAPCNDDTTRSVDCYDKEYCFTEKRGGEVVFKDCVQSPFHSGVTIKNQVIKISKQEIRMSSTEDDTEKFYCRWGDYCNGKS